MLLRSKIRRLPPVHQATLKALIEHLARVAAKCEKNKMDPKNLAIVFGGVIFGDDEMPKGGDLLSVQTVKVTIFSANPTVFLMPIRPQDTLMEDLIVHANTLYDTPAVPNSPPLPPTPAGEPVPPLTYGSKTTIISTVPSIPSSISAQDFTPSLPPRPNNSIHISSRASYSPNKSKSYPEKALERIVAEIPSPPSPISEGRNSVIFPAQSEPLDEEHSLQKSTDEPQFPKS